MRIVIDSREQQPYTFRGYDIQIELGTLLTGDYSLAGFTDRIAIERKELSDLIQCLSWERERFSREMQRAKGYDFFAVIIEASWQAMAEGNYRSRMKPQAACQSVRHLWQDLEYHSFLQATDKRLNMLPILY